MSTTNGKTSDDEVRLGRLVIDDVRGGRLFEAYRRDLRDIYRFYLSDDQRERLAGMGRVKRFFWIIGWLARNLLLRLAPARRVLLLIAAILVVGNGEFDFHGNKVILDFAPLGAVIVLVVLMLELKDKLLARDEIEVARQVQISLLPRSHPHVPGWEIWSATTPANDVGGDLVDYLDGRDGRTGVALGDVAGKGMGAALLCAKLQATLRALAPDAPDLEHLGERLNGVLAKAGLDNRYATLFYGEISAGQSEFRYLNAGHNPAFLVRDGEVRSLEASSLPLGMLPDVRYSQGRESLVVGDTLVLYSDGITEATQASGEEYGAERLRRAIVSSRSGSAEAIARAVLDDVGAFLDGEKPHDDQSLMVLRRTA